MARELRRERRIAILGAGMLGTILAILLGRQGVNVTVFEAAERPLDRAGRWNEGKIHLGYTYAADRSLETAQKLIPGGIAFQRIVEDLIDGSIESHLTTGDDVFLTHTKSAIDAEAMSHHFNAVWALLSQVQDGARRPSRLTRLELTDITRNADIVAGFRIPERSIDSNWLADRLVARLIASDRVELVCNCPVRALSQDGRNFRIVTSGGDFSGFDTVVNALWEGQSRIDNDMGRPVQPLSYRYRVAVFAKAPGARLDNTLIMTGPFGDTKNYDGEHLYLSWYPAGLLLDRHQEHAPPAPELNDAMEADIGRNVLAGLGVYFPAVLDIPRIAERQVVRGGWIVAHGEGTLSDPNSPLHRRDQFGISRHGSYYSVQTGKFSVAPWLASKLADGLLG